MATQKQKKLAKAIVENLTSKETKTAGQLLEIAGYNKTTAEATPGLIIDQKGVKEELGKLGISLETADEVVGGILKKGKDEHKLKAADLTYKRLGGYAPEKHDLTGNLKTIIINKHEKAISIPQGEDITESNP